MGLLHFGRNDTTYGNLFMTFNIGSVLCLEAYSDSFSYFPILSVIDRVVLESSSGTATHSFNTV